MYSSEENLFLPNKVFYSLSILSISEAEPNTIDWIGFRNGFLVPTYPISLRSNSLELLP